MAAGTVQVVSWIVTEATSWTAGTREISLGLNQLLVPWLPDVTSLGIKRPERVVHHSCQSSVRVKNAHRYVSTPTARLHGTDWDNITYTANADRHSCRAVECPLQKPVIWNCHASTLMSCYSSLNKLHGLYYSPSIIWVIKARRIR